METINEIIQSDCQKMFETKQIIFMNQKKEQIYINSFFGLLVCFCLTITLIIALTLIVNHQSNWYTPLLLTSIIFSLIFFTALLLIYFLKMRLIKIEKNNNQKINQKIPFAKYYQHLNCEMNQEINQKNWPNNFTEDFQNKELFFQKGLTLKNEEWSITLSDFYFKEKKKWTLNQFNYIFFSYAEVNNLKQEKFAQEDVCIAVNWLTNHGEEFNQLHVESETTENDWSILFNPNLRQLLSDYFTKNYYFQPQIIIHQNQILIISQKKTIDNLQLLYPIDQIENVFSAEEMINSITKKIEEKNLEIQMYLKLTQLFSSQ